MRFATPDELGESDESGEEYGERAPIVEPTEATVDLPDSGTMTIAEALGEHDQAITVARGYGEIAQELVEQQQETIQRQEAQIEELREAIEVLAGQGGQSIEWDVEGWD